MWGFKQLRGSSRGALTTSPARWSELSLPDETFPARPLVGLKEGAEEGPKMLGDSEQLQPTSITSCASQRLQKGLFGGSALILKQR